MRIIALLPALGLLVALAGQSSADEIDWTKVDAALGKSASVQADVHRYGIPRSDLQVIVDGVTIKPSLALGGWLGFEPTTGGAVVMGDLVPDRDRDRAGNDKAAKQWHRRHRASQPPTAR